MPINYLKKIQLRDFNGDDYRVAPSALLESVVEGFYVFSRAPEDDTHLVFNDGFPVLVFLQTARDTVTVTAQAKATEIKAAWASAGSIRNVYVKYNANTEQIFVVRFYPGAFYRLFGLNAQYFRTNPVAPLEPVAKKNNFSLEKFFSCGSIDEKIAFVEDYVKNSISSHHTPEIIHKTLEHINKIKGNSTVQNLTEDAGVNYKWLERNFVQYIGLMPKEYIQLQRFIHAYLELVGSRDVDLMRIAVSTGYYDSNHFLKDFKAYTGKTPLAYLKFTNPVSRERI